jgi:hypothetical protein
MWPQRAGDLYFPLPDGATVSSYVLDVNGVMVDGVAVENERVRAAAIVAAGNRELGKNGMPTAIPGPRTTACRHA